jgi:prepilin-type N-terminal cleavage/methylation domain-containing protein
VKKLFNIKGFTMIELITAVVIMSIIAVMAGMGLVQIARGYLLAKTSTANAEQSQIALTRILKELTAVQTITEATATSLTYTRGGTSHTLSWAGLDQALTLDGDKLIDKVHSFNLTYRDTYNTTTPSSYSSATMVIEFSFQLKGFEGSTLIFTERVVI